MNIARRAFIANVGLGVVGASYGRRAAAAVSTAGSELDADVFVAGGSMTGVFAAIRAAQAGKRVVLVERRSSFGGTATQGLVPVLHSLYSTDGKTKISGGLTQEVIDRLLARGEAELWDKTDKNVYCWMNVAELQLVLDEMVRDQPLVQTHFETLFTGVETDRPGHVTRAFFEDKGGRHAVRAKVFIDATGDADLVRRTEGLEVWRHPKDDLQGQTLCAMLSGVDAVRRAHPDFSFYEVLKPERGLGLKHVYCWSEKMFNAPHVTFISGTRISACDPSEPEDLTAALFEARRQLRVIIDGANKFYPVPKGDRGISLLAIAPALGVRESVHIKSLYRITDKDILMGKRFDDVAARGCYRVDHHEKTGLTFRYLDGTEEVQAYDAKTGKVAWRHGRWRPETRENPTWYEVPYRSLVPAGAENVIAAGRMLDCSREAFGALRVMVNCNQMGEIAGRAAAKAVDESLSIASAYPGKPIV